ncbi:hypothetical protein R3P38DRAFT_3481279 [Favolaschia claudopus]|uniref:Uncharacterized protein n=1 Tax=Favolaschia claudopus TaxID=2862362 RepID=A0AAW0CCU5_9AGAR
MVSSDSDEDVTVVEGPSQLSASDLDAMIEGVIADHPAGILLYSVLPGALLSTLFKACNKFLVRTPEVMAAQAKKAEKKAAKRKRASEETDTAAATETKPPAKRRSKTKAPAADSDEPPPSITYYIKIPKEAPAPTKKRTPKPTEDDTLQKGPFILPMSASYLDLLSAIATELPCLVENINQSKIMWKTKKPLTGDKFPLGKAVGYAAMVEELKGKAERVVILFMPPPNKPMEEPMLWETEEAPPPTFDYSELERAGPSGSIAEQKISFNASTRTERAKLEEKYPIGNDPRWPNLRVYHQPETGYFFDLNATRLGVWAASMSQKLTDEKTAPASRFFDAQQRIKNIPPMPSALHNSSLETTVTPLAPAVPVPAIPAPAPVPAPAPTLSMTDIFLASLMSGGGLPALFPQLSPANHASTPAGVPAIPSPSLSQPRSAPPSPVKRHNVQLDQFCDLYGFAEGDASLLKDVGFRPGDKTPSTLDDELQKAGFTIFSWRRIHNANVRFKGDLASGVFDS